MLETRLNSVKRTRKHFAIEKSKIPGVARWFYVILIVFSVCISSSKCHNLHQESDSDFVVTQESIADRHLGRQCRHAHPKHDEVVRGVKLEDAHIVRKRSTEQPLRIVLYYDHSVYRLEPEKFDLINNTILPGAVQFWEKTLMVRKTADIIKLNRKCSSRQVFVKNGRTHCIGACKPITTCGEVQVPEEHLNPCYVCNATGHNCGPIASPSPDSVPDPGVRPVSVPANGTHAGSGGITHADFVLYVSAVETERCTRGLTVAYAAHCQQEAALDRPIAGHANFCPSELSTRPQELGSMMSTVQHEMLHALGFSVSLFAFYRDDEGNPLTERNQDTGSPPLNEELQIHQWSDRVVKNVTRERWMVRGGFMTRNIQVMITPRVVKEVREHYGCSSLEGAELEDQGGEGTALTHWEKRIMENEAMTGTHTQNPVFSRITLALMEDTGWYKADYSQAQELGWGKDLGCSFATRSCKEWISNAAGNDGEDPEVDLGGRSAHPFCSRVKRDPLQTECSQQRDSVALCNLVLHDRPLPPLYQHFDWVADAEPGTEGQYGGSVSLADYCPYTQEFTWKFKNQVVRGSRCSFVDNNPHEDKNFALESYGESSKCFDHTNRMWEQRSCKQVRQWQHWGSGCYDYKCEGGRLHLMVGNYSYECYHSGQEISIRIVRGGWLHRGALLCPPCRDLCQKQFQGRGEWCKPGDEAPPNTAYPRDDLSCGSGAGGASRAPPARLHIIAVGISLGALAASALCLCTGIITKLQGCVRNCRDRNAVKQAKINKAKFKLEEVVIAKKDAQSAADNEEQNMDASDLIASETLVEENPRKFAYASPSREECCTNYASASVVEVDSSSKFEEAVRSVLDKSLGFQDTCVEDSVDFDADLKRKISRNEDSDEIKRFDDSNSSFKGKRARKDSKGRDSRRKISQQKGLDLMDETPGYFVLDEPVVCDGIELEMMNVEASFDQNNPMRKSNKSSNR